MNIIAEAKMLANPIRTNGDLLAAQREMLKTMFQHHAISEAEYHKSLSVLYKASLYKARDAAAES